MNVLVGRETVQGQGQMDEALLALRTIDRDAVSLRRGETLIGASAPTEHYYFILQGTLRVWYPLADGRRQITAFLFPGDWVGLDNLRECNATIEAVTAVRAERYPLRAMLLAATQDTRIMAALKGVLRASLEAAQNRILVLGHRNTREKLASFILEMADRLSAGGDTICLPMSRYDIGDYLGMSSETVCRNFTQFAADGIIALPEPSRVCILRREMLEFISLDFRAVSRCTASVKPPASSAL